LKEADTIRLKKNIKKGTNQSNMRAHNEKLILSLLRDHSGLAKIEIAKMTGLTAQTSSVIMRKLESEGLLLSGEPIRGNVGQPTIPMTLNPDGAFFFGLKVGRRTAQLVLVDVLGKVKHSVEVTYRYPTPDLITSFAVDSTAKITNKLNKKTISRIDGFGIALPFKLWNWLDEVDAPFNEMISWKTTNIMEAIQQKLPYKVYLQNDATAACAAELAFGSIKNNQDCLYLNISTFIGGGIILNNQLYTGSQNDAGSVGSMPIARKNKETKQLIDIASLNCLEKKLKENGASSAWIWDSPNQWASEGEEITEWIADAGEAIAHSILASCSVINFEIVIIDGWLPQNILSQLISIIENHLNELDSEGLRVPVVQKGSLGVNAKSIGAASLPLSERFLIGSVFGNH